MAHRAPAGIAERRVALAASEPALAPLAAGLRRAGLAVATINPATGYDAALGAAEAAVGRLDVAVWAATLPGLGVPADLHDVDEATWRDLVGGSLRSFADFLQAAERRLAGHDGRIVVVVPTIAGAGAPRLVAWTSVGEAQRSLVKSIARTWGANGITANCVAVPAALLVAAAEDLDRPHLQPAALSPPRLGVEVADVIAAMCGAGFAGVTGMTIGVDGGRWIPA